MDVIASFTNAGTPATGLSATVSIWKTDGTVVVNASAMTEIAGGFYKYTFSTYNDAYDYVIRADGGNTLSAPDRYKMSANDLGQVTNPLNLVKKIEANKMKIETNQLKIYEDDGVTVAKTYDLFDENGSPSMTSVFQRNPV
jgi:hypothetical protein